MLTFSSPVPAVQHGEDAPVPVLTLLFNTGTTSLSARAIVGLSLPWFFCSPSSRPRQTPDITIRFIDSSFFSPPSFHNTEIFPPIIQSSSLIVNPWGPKLYFVIIDKSHITIENHIYLTFCQTHDCSSGQNGDK